MTVCAFGFGIFWDGSLSCDVSERYLWFWKIDGGEKISSAEVLQVDFGTLHGTGLPMNATRFDVKIFHQGHTGKETFTAFQTREEFGNPAAMLEDTVLALQRIGRCGCAFLNG